MLPDGRHVAFRSARHSKQERNRVRRPAIPAPEDGRADWFVGGADRATRVPDLLPR